MGIFNKINSLFRNKNTQETIDSLENVLLESGLSPHLVYETMSLLEKNIGSIHNTQKIIAVLKKILEGYAQESSFILPSACHMYIFIGVNGVGKTTSIAKFIYYLQHIHNVASKDIVVAAGDTFRAGAIEQLSIHCDSLAVPIIKQQAGSDAAAVVFDTISYAQSKKVRYIISDTAGRMDNRKDLIAQLQKIYRLAQKSLANTQITTFIVIDANSGLNTLTQVENFKEAVPVHALILSKYDGSSRGGTILSISHKYNVPCAFLGTGETYQDFREFNKMDFLDEFLL